MKSFILPICCACAVSMAQAQPVSRPVSLIEAMRLSVGNSAQLKKAQLDRQALENRLATGKSAFLPQVNAYFGMDFLPGQPTAFLPATVLDEPAGGYVATTLGQPWQLAGSVRAEQAIFDEAARRMSRAASISRGLYDLLADKTEDDVLAGTASVFYQALQTEKLLDAAHANITKLEAMERAAQLQLDNGYAVPTDVKRVRVARTNLESQRYNLQVAAQSLRQTLQYLCGIPFEEPIRLVDETTAIPGADSARWQSLALDLETTTEHRLLQRQIELNRVQTRSLRGEIVPKIGAYAAIGFMSQRPDANFFAEGQRWYSLAAVGFHAEVPIFDGFRNRRKTAGMVIERQKMEEDVRQLGQAKKLEFLQAKARFQGALQILHTQTENTALAREIAEKMALQYSQGTIALTDLLGAQTALAEAETQYWQQVFNYKLAVVNLLKSVGKIGKLEE
ncbi:MAG: TolC family protein [Saprospiraceae bacterium]